MNLVRGAAWAGRCPLGAVTAVLLVCAAGCGPTLPSADELAAFEKAGPLRPTVDVGRLIRARMPAGPYRLVPGDVLELRMPAVMRAVAPEPPDQIDPYLCRVSDDGMIFLPNAEKVNVADKTLSQTEAAVVALYHPKYVVHRPSVVARVTDHQTVNVSITGAVQKPGLYALRSDEMSLVNLIMKSKGIVDEGAAVIRICQAGDDNGKNRIVLPVKGLNIPFADAELQDGDIVEVEQINPQVFTVIGLVKESGTFPYPPGVRYNLMQALAFAGGVDKLAAPKYARVYRQCGDGSIITASFRLQGTSPVDAANLIIKPGDIVAVEHTFSTKTRLFLAQIFPVTTGINAFATYRLDTSFDDVTSR